MNEVFTKIIKKKLVDLKPADYNPRLITDDAFEGLGKSISKFGMLSHIVWNEKSGNIVGGHQRYKQLVEMGEIETDVVVVNLEHHEEMALNITLNNPQIRGDFTKGVIDQLRLSEAQLGSAFRQVGLLDLYEYLRSKGFEREKPPVSVKDDIKVESNAKTNDESEDEFEDVEEDNSLTPQAVIVCSSCKSQWKLTNNDVVFNAITGTGKRVEKDVD